MIDKNRMRRLAVVGMVVVVAVGRKAEHIHKIQEYPHNEKQRSTHEKKRKGKKSGSEAKQYRRRCEMARGIKGRAKKEEVKGGMGYHRGRQKQTKGRKSGGVGDAYVRQKNQARETQACLWIWQQGRDGEKNGKGKTKMRRSSLYGPVLFPNSVSTRN